MSVYRKEYSGEFTDYVIIDFPTEKKISSFFSGLNEQSFLEIFNLAENYISKHFKTDYSFALIDPNCLNDLPFYHKTSDGEVLLDVKSRAMYHLNLLSNNGEIYYKNKKFICAKDKNVETFLNRMIQKNLILVHKEENHSVVFLVADPSLGKLSKYALPNNIVTNSHFFLMEMFELNSYHSCLGQPYGGLILGGKTVTPLLYERPTLISGEKNSKLKDLSIKNMHVIIDNEKYVHKENSEFYKRPENSVSPKAKGTDLVIINSEIVGYKHGGETKIPEGGFILHTNEEFVPTSRKVKYAYGENSRFLIQVGPALIEEGKAIDKINGEFYWDKVKRDKNCPYFPPVIFETEWNDANAARMALGFKSNKTIILWACGCNSEKYIPGYDSRGLTFSEMTEILNNEQVENAVSLDGGGSAQALTFGGKILRLNDRRGFFGIEYERPTPMGLKITI